MKEIIRKIVPRYVLDRRTKRRYSKNASKYKDWDIRSVFSHIYRENAWGLEETVSGQGSSIDQMGPILPEIEAAFQRLNIQSVLDIPCGDFNWMQHVNLSGIHYVGGDIVPELVESNKQKYGGENVEFELLDLTSDQLPKADLVLVKDCFIHFSYAHIYQAMQRIKESGATYLMSTTSVGTTVNFDIATGDWRSVNLQFAPFHFPEPMQLIREYCRPGSEKAQRGKSLGIWKLEEMHLPENGY